MLAGALLLVEADSAGAEALLQAQPGRDGIQSLHKQCARVAGRLGGRDAAQRVDAHTQAAGVIPDQLALGVGVPHHVAQQDGQGGA